MHAPQVVIQDVGCGPVESVDVLEDGPHDVRPHEPVSVYAVDVVGAVDVFIHPVGLAFGLLQVLPAVVDPLCVAGQVVVEGLDLVREIITEQGVILEDKNGLHATVQAVLDDAAVRYEAAPGAVAAVKPFGRAESLAVEGPETFDLAEGPARRES